MLAPRITSVVVVQEGMKPGRWHTPTTAPIRMIRVLLSFLFSWYRASERDFFVKTEAGFGSSFSETVWSICVMFVWIWHVWSTFVMLSSLNSCMFVYVDDRYRGNAILRDIYALKLIAASLWN